ncbi:unnamed protein product [Litomosoides sigmodontis]|uniref:Uncharacterized protein n=1 Tax=Litomosoides sigmodontis TaxID=42156 RepID=A0A3P6TCU8_LITSI|nr:unnamed protein product [Litomosoides sigmodontis]
MVFEEEEELKQYLVVAAAVLSLLILLVLACYIFKRAKTFSIVFPVSNPTNNKSTLPGIADNAVSDGKSTYTELKKKAGASFNVLTLQSESGLI